MEAFSDLVGRQLRALALVTRDDGPGRRHPGEAGQPQRLPQLHPASLPEVPLAMSDRSRVPLDAAVDLTRTGDLWLFRGRSAADHAIRAVTNSPVNHVGMAVVLDDLPPLMWHAELGRGLVDVWTGTYHRGVQLHDLRAAVEQWTTRYAQRAWLRQLDAPVTTGMESALLTTIAKLDGTPFPATTALAGRWVRGRLLRRPASVETTYCAEVVAATYAAMGLLGDARPTNYYDPGSFWSGDELELSGGARLGDEIAVSPG
jgi:hypothetical protein